MNTTITTTTTITTNHNLKVENKMTSNKRASEEMMNTTDLINNNNSVTNNKKVKVEELSKLEKEKEKDVKVIVEKECEIDTNSVVREQHNITSENDDEMISKNPIVIDFIQQIRAAKVKAIPGITPELHQCTPFLPKPVWTEIGD
eukprot:Pgem_evm1s1222